MADNYKCTLDAKGLKIAQKELNEDPGDRLGSVQKFREWILSQEHLKCPTDTEYLLRFLRTAKFSQLRARETLEGYLTMKTQNPAWYDNIDTKDPGLVAFLKSGYLLPLGFSKRGHFVILYRAGVLDTRPKAPYKMNDIWHGAFAALINYLGNENVLVNGLAYIMDLTGFELRHATYWGTDTIKKSSKMFQGNFYGRFKGFHYYNIGPAFEGVMAVFKPLLSKKFRDRIHIHETLESIYKEIGMEQMPVEFLPDDYEGPNAGTLEDISNRLIEKLQTPEVRDRILYETSDKWRIDASKKPSDVPSESFRKLNVD
ncbi:hypothetical protein CAPTEDRAFT_229063 [Capitella teleta]|uniref:CRAL-TRIO domain-containing protein n=1 Tax=Capitella teleta TaxID=283909 RepID=X2B1B4_CAPTE|nr:hypothetical protein CAPTEDRAFT_229063 [Capitella teleta]|eukprot:ELU00286.1 hypothetical protein CAPTEDRAFT_229063 [Capitella teleta]